MAHATAIGKRVLPQIKGSRITDGRNRSGLRQTQRVLQKAGGYAAYDQARVGAWCSSSGSESL